ncbi:hypothetical protein AB0N18_18440 [Streptomyces griseoincarnatus]
MAAVRRLLCPRPGRPRSDLTLRFAGGTTGEKTRRLNEPSTHDDDLRTLTYQMIDAGLQRGSLTGVVLRGDDLVRGDQVAQQTSLDTTREARLVAEAVMDRIRDKFGLGIDAGRNPPRLLNLLLKPSGREALCRFSRPDAVPPVDAPALHPGRRRALTSSGIPAGVVRGSCTGPGSARRRTRRSNGSPAHRRAR